LVLLDHQAVVVVTDQLVHELPGGLASQALVVAPDEVHGERIVQLHPLGHGRSDVPRRARLMPAR
jgi:hypothetical protein